MPDYNAKVFAHRGGREWAPENTMAAFRKSLEAGVYGIELDVQRCASGELVVFHDHDLSRTTNGAGLIKDCTFDELKRLSAGSWFDAEFRSEKVPSLDEVLSLVDGQVVINVELKNTPVDYPGIEDDVIAVLSEYEQIDKIIFSCFDNRLTKKMAAKKPEWNYAILMDGIPDDVCGMATSVHARFWHPNHESLLEDAVSEAKNGGLSVYPWTVNGEKDWVRMLKLGVDGIMTDDPSGLINLLQTVAKMVG